MFTPSMTSEEIAAAAYKDFLEIRGKIQIAEDKFGKLVRSIGTGTVPCSLHSLQETHTIRTRAKNTWNVSFFYSGTTPTGCLTVGANIYTLLPRDKGTDFLFLTSLKKCNLERLSAHFLRRYRERYIEPNQIKLGNIHPAIYFIRTNRDRRLTYYAPNTWTEEERASKYILASKQGLMVLTRKENMETYITFMDQESLGDYRTRMYEEEMIYRKFKEAGDMDVGEQLPLFRNLYRDRDVVRPKMLCFIRRMADSEEHYQQLLNGFENVWDAMLRILDAAEASGHDNNRIHWPSEPFG